MSSLLLADGVADRNGSDHHGQDHHELREQLIITHDSAPPFHLCCGCEGKAKSQAPSVVLQAMEPFYSSMAIISCRIMSVNTAEQLFNMFGFISVKPCNNRHHRPRSHIPPPSPGYTERPARVQFMLGRIGLYEYHTYTHQRPDSSRPQAARSRVACAKRSGVQGIIPCPPGGVWRFRRG